MRYPRVANRLAWHWRDPAMALAVLDDLLTDRRGGRQGFPKPVALELHRLRELVARGADAPGPHDPLDGWRRFWSRH